MEKSVSILLDFFREMSFKTASQNFYGTVISRKMLKMSTKQWFWADDMKKKRILSYQCGLRFALLWHMII
jgi:hypothetical protein